MSSERAYSVQDARDLFARWENGHATEADLAGGLYALIEALSTPPADDVREALAEIERWKDRPTITRRSHMDQIEGLERLRDLLAAEVRPHGTFTYAEVKPAETYSVYGGQGLRRIASGLSREDAERVSRKFEIDCMNAGLTNPPGRIEREARS